MEKILTLLDECYDDLAKLILFADGSGHIINESLDGGAGEHVFDFENLAILKRHLTQRAGDTARMRKAAGKLSKDKNNML